MTEPAKTIATVRSYRQLMSVFRARSDELEITRQTVDAAAGLPPGYSGKLLAPIPIKNVGINSLGALLGVLGLALIVVEDSDAALTFKTKLVKRQRRQAER